MKIGYIPIAAKPYHKGHHCLVEIASKECDFVKLFVSAGDRNRTGEVKIKAATMQEIWNQYILSILPENVEVFFVKSPVRSIYESVGQENELKSNHSTHVIYGDDVDVQSYFPESQLNKYFSYFYENKLVEVKAVPRTTTVEISGTAMRKFLELNLCDDFIDGLPDQIKNNGINIWNILKENNF